MTPRRGPRGLVLSAPRLPPDARAGMEPRGGLVDLPAGPLARVCELLGRGADCCAFRSLCRATLGASAVPAGVELAPLSPELPASGAPGLRAAAALSLHRVEVADDAAVRALVGAFPALTRLDLSGCARITGEALRAVAALPGLEVLCLCGCDRLTGRDLAHLGGLTGLLGLSLRCGRVEDLSRLSGARSLRWLDLGGMALLGDDAAAGLAAAGLTALVALDLSRWSLTEVGVSRLRGLTALTSLDLGFCQGVGDGALESLARALPGLRSLGLHGCGVTDAGVGHLRAVTALGSLDVSCCGDVTGRGLAALRLKRVFATGCRSLASGGLDPLLALPGLQSLDVGLSFGVGAEALVRLGDLAGLRHLGVSGLDVTPGVLARLRALAGLHSLYIDGTDAEDEDLALLRPLTALRSLDIGRTLVTGEGLAHLRPLTALRSLGLERLPLAEPDGDRLRALPELEVVYLARGTSGHLRGPWLERLRGVRLEFGGMPPMPRDG